ncbi:hypothetical protein MLD38_033710 [Melastoma candidum]|uniref:Uncharacterized protein n=1 Tax=Melastoma candidum TaxID=119954 RepID=A0ACB9M8Z1_9MYRT|nr:hypothetical protein MLD38_033710 [Melastoma candidum]
MAADTLSATPAAEEVVVVTPDVTTTTKFEEKPEKELPLPPTHEPDPDAAVEKLKDAEKEEYKITQVASFKEETYVVAELPEEQRKALEELRKLIREALEKHELSALPVKEEVKVEAEEKKVEGGEDKKDVKEEVKVETAEPPKIAEEAVTAVEESITVVEETVVEKEAVVQGEVEEKIVDVAVTEVSEKLEVEVAGEKAVEDIKETIVEVTSAVAPPPPEVKSEEPKELEEVNIWGIPLLKDERSDVILLKFLRARDFKVKESFAMLKSVVAWRKEFGIDSLAEESLGSGLKKTVFIHGVDKKGHPVCYNVLGAFCDKELYANTFGDEEKRKNFLKWRIHFFEKSIGQLDMSPGGVSTFVQVIDVKNSPGLKKEIRLTTDKTLQLLQDNYPEFVAKQVLINVPWWYLAYTKIMSPFLTQRTKSKIVLVGPSRTAAVLFKYIAPEQVPVQYGGLSRDDEQEFTTADAATEATVKPSTKHTIEFPVSEKCTFVWEARVLGANASYGAQFVPDSEESYTMIVHKSRKITSSDEPIITGCFKASEPGKVVLTIDNHSSKKMKLLYRSKIKTTSD